MPPEPCIEDVVPSASCTGTLPLDQAGRLNLKYACCTAAGTLNGLAKQNQDSWVINEQALAGSEHVLFGVMDGHGPHGLTVSSLVAEALPQMISKAWTTVGRSDLQERKECMERCFKSCNDTLSCVPGLDCSFSGSTCIVALVSTYFINIANVGDSRCVLGRVGADRSALAFDMSNDHTPEALPEANRVLAAGGRIAPFKYGGKSVGPLRVWLRDQDTPGLSMTRSFGDSVAAAVGVIDVPEVLVYEMVPEDRYLVLCSDGITEHMATDEIIQLVHRCSDVLHYGPRKTAKTLVKEARRRWTAAEAGGTIDDCTAIVVFLEPVIADANKNGWKAINSLLKRGMRYMTGNGQQ